MYSKRDAIRGIGQFRYKSTGNSILLPFSGVFPADAFGWRVSTFVVLCFPGPFELGYVISEDISGPQGGDEIIELAFLSIREGAVTGTIAIAMPVAIRRVLPKGFAN